MNAPFFSIITPVLNSEKTIEACLDSVARQTFVEKEHLIIDGLSTDRTLEIVKKYQKKYKHIRFISERDHGIYDAMNKGIELANGEWMYFLGSDDILFTEETLGVIYQYTSMADLKVVYGNVIVKGDTGWAKDGQIYDGEFTLSRLIDRNICHQSIFFKKEVFKKIGNFNTEYTVCADWDFNLKLWAKYKLAYLNVIIAIFKGGNSSFREVNNFTNIEKWSTIFHSFKLTLASDVFTKYKYNFFVLAKYYFNKGKYHLAMFSFVVFLFHKMRSA